MKSNRARVDSVRRFAKCENVKHELFGNTISRENSSIQLTNDTQK